MSKSSYNADKASSTYNMLTMLLVAFALGAAALHFVIDGKQKYLLQTTSMAEQQFGLAQTVAMLVAQHQLDNEESTLDNLKEKAALLLQQNDTIASYFLPVMGQASLKDTSALQTLGLSSMRGIAGAAFSYTSAPNDENAKQRVAEISTMATKELRENWGKDVATYTAALQKQISMMTYGLYGLSGIAALLALYLSAGMFKPAAQYIKSLLEHIDHVAATDTLTGLYNRVMLFKVTAMLISGAKRHKQELAVLAIDIDELQKINDAHGRAAGDGAIKAVAATLGQVLRNSDVMGRVAGQEFAIFLPATDEYRASLVAEKLRAAVEETHFAVKEHMIMLRVSVGVAEIQPHHKNSDDMLRAAETALRHAKENGRNKVICLSKIQSIAPATTMAV